MSISWQGRKRIREDAEYLAQTQGGEVEHWVDKLTPDGEVFTDQFLIDQGYEKIAEYDYKAPNGTLLYQSIKYRHKLVTAAKEFLQRRKDYKNGITWVFGAGKIKVPYRWGELIAAVRANPDVKVYYAEGEKDVDRLISHGLVATTVAGQKWSPEAAEAFRDLHVRILEDNDEAGRTNSANAAKALSYEAKTIKVVLLPGLPHKGDVSDWLDAGHTVDELTRIAEDSPSWGVSSRKLDMSTWDSTDVPVTKWSVENRIPEGHVSILSGAGGGGNSRIELQRAVCHVLGVRWLGAEVKKGKAILIDAEDGEDEIHRRLAAITRHHDVNFADLVNDLHLYSWVGEEALLATVNRSGIIEPTRRYRWLLELAHDIMPVTIGIASAANIFGGNENDRSQVQQFISLLTRIAMACHGSVNLISHPSLSGMTTDSGLSGSTQWHNAVRARSHLKDATSPNGEDVTSSSNYRTLIVKKNNYGPDSETINLMWSNGLYLPVTANIVEAQVRLARAEEVFLTQMRKLISQGHDLNPIRNSPVYAPAMIAELPEVRAEMFTKADMAAAQQRLIDDSKIHIGWLGSPSRGRKVLKEGPRPPNDDDDEIM